MILLAFPGILPDTFEPDTELATAAVPEILIGHVPDAPVPVNVGEYEL